MANNPISMGKIRRILRLHSQGRSKLQIAEQTGVSRNTLKKYLLQAAACEFRFEELDKYSDKDLEDLFCRIEAPELSPKLKALMELFPQMEKELKKKGVTRQVLFEEYKTICPDGVGRTQFNHYFSQWKSRQSPSMRMEHKAGDKLFVDFAGDKLFIVDATTGEQQPVEVFVAILGASQLTYVQAVASQQKEDFIAACEGALHYYGGVPAAIVPDNLRSAVTKSCKYEPVINEDYADFAEHYSTSILPARAYRPKDKAHVENAVKIVYSRIYARLRNTICHNLEELNMAILEALELHNNAHLKGRDYSRRQQFEELERPVLMALPERLYEIKQFRYGTVAKNGHVVLACDHHYYSVPYKYIGRKVKMVYSRKTVEIYYNHERIALHNRVKSAYAYSTDPEHMASTHRFVSEWTPEKFLEWAASIGEDVRVCIQAVLDKRQHPEQAYKSCLGILSLGKKYGQDRLIKACDRAIGFGSFSYAAISNILAKGLEEEKEEGSAAQSPMPSHDNIRGSDYYR